MTESQDTCDPLIATLLRALVARSAQTISLTTPMASRARRFTRSWTASRLHPPRSPLSFGARLAIGVRLNRSRFPGHHPITIAAVPSRRRSTEAHHRLHRADP